MMYTLNSNQSNWVLLDSVPHHRLLLQKAREDAARLSRRNFLSTIISFLSLRSIQCPESLDCKLSCERIGTLFKRRRKKGR